MVSATIVLCPPTTFTCSGYFKVDIELKKNVVKLLVQEGYFAVNELNDFLVTQEKASIAK